MHRYLLQRRLLHRHHHHHHHHHHRHHRHHQVQQQQKRQDFATACHRPFLIHRHHRVRRRRVVQVGEGQGDRGKIQTQAAMDLQQRQLRAAKNK